MVGRPVGVVVLEHRVSAEHGHERVRDQIFRDERVISLIPGMQCEIGAGVRANQQSGDGDRERGRMKAMSGREAIGDPDEHRSREHDGERPGWEP